MTAIADFEMTQHAIKRALEMGIGGDEIRQCLLYPENVVQSKRHDGRNYRAGRITCGVVDGCVVTVVWSSPDGWREDIEAYGLYEGRQYRGL